MMQRYLLSQILEHGATSPSNCPLNTYLPAESSCALFNKPYRDDKIRTCDPRDPNTVLPLQVTVHWTLTCRQSQAATYSINRIGMTRFELATPATRTRCATKLRYIPIRFIVFSFYRQMFIQSI